MTGNRMAGAVRFDGDRMMELRLARLTLKHTFLTSEVVRSSQIHEFLELHGYTTGFFLHRHPCGCITVTPAVPPTVTNITDHGWA